MIKRDNITPLFNDMNLRIRDLGQSDGGDGGMNFWQNSVENRLGLIHTDISGIKTEIGDVKSVLVRIEERLDHLPTWTSMLIILSTAIGIVVGIPEAAEIIKLWITK